MDFVSIFFLLGTITLLQLAWQDWKHKAVRTDLSSYMMGVSGVIFLVLDLILVWIGFMLLILFGLSFLKQVKFLTKHIKAGDITVLGWIIPSLIILNPLYFITWLFFWCVGNVLIAFGLKKKEFAGLIPMFFGFLLTGFLIWIGLL
jgi:hypothetical protein